MPVPGNERAERVRAAGPRTGHVTVVHAQPREYSCWGGQQDAWVSSVEGDLGGAELGPLHADLPGLRRGPGSETRRAAGGARAPAGTRWRCGSSSPGDGEEIDLPGLLTANSRLKPENLDPSSAVHLLPRQIEALGSDRPTGSPSFLPRGSRPLQHDVAHGHVAAGEHGGHAFRRQHVLNDPHHGGG